MEIFQYAQVYYRGWKGDINMNTFNITIDIVDTISTNCKTCEKFRTVTFLNSNQEETLQDDYILRVLSCSQNRALIQLQKSNFYFIRFIYLNITTICCLPSDNKCIEHQLSLTPRIIAC